MDGSNTITAGERMGKTSSDELYCVAVVGLGYVGLPLAIEFSRAGHDVIGFDIDEKKIRALRAGNDTTGDLGDDAIRNSNIEFTTDDSRIDRADYVLVAVPTPVDDLKNPNLKYVEAAGELIGHQITAGTTVILESTVYPGATQEIFTPAIESTSGLTAGEDFFVGYSPERLVPGDDEHGLRNVVKIVSGQTDDVLEDVATLYETVVEVGVHRAPGMEVAEAAKCIENVQRDLNIALVNELAIACERLDLDTKAVLEAAETKWNFHSYRPGLVGGHCIPVDPFFMIYELERNGFTPNLIQQARDVNEYVPHHVAELVLKGLNECGKVPKESSVLILGLSYKPGVGDVRTSAIGGTISKLESYGINITGYDSCAEYDKVQSEFGIEAQSEMDLIGYDGLVIATGHEEIINYNYKDNIDKMNEKPFLVDVPGIKEADKLKSAGYNYKTL